MSKKKPGAGRYVMVWLCLVTLTALSYLSSRLHLGSLDVVVAMLIASVKSLLVLLFFMHLREARASHALVPAVCVGLIGLLFSLVAADVATRHTFPKAPIPAVDGP